MVTISLYKVVDNVSFDEEKGVFSDNVSFGEKRFVECDDMRINHKREVLSYKNAIGVGPMNSESCISLSSRTTILRFTLKITLLVMISLIIIAENIL